MDSLGVSDRIFQAIHNGSLDELRHLLDDKETILTHLSARDEDERTPLHVAMQKKSFDIIDFLVKIVKDNINIERNVRSKFIRRMSVFSWNKVDVDRFSIGPPEENKEFTQTFVLPTADTEIIRDIANEIDIFKLMEYLIDMHYDDTSWFEFITNSFIASSMPRREKIIALELMGAAFIIKELVTEVVLEDDSVCVRGLQCWEKAFELRNSTANGRLPIAKIAQVLSDVECKAIGRDVVEVTVPAQLEEMQQHLIRRDRPSQAFAQALLVILRTFDQRDVQHRKPNYFQLKILLEYSQQLPLDDTVRIANVCLLILERLNKYNGQDSPKCLQVFLEAFLLLCNVFHRLERDPVYNAERREELTFTNLLAAIEHGSVIVTYLVFHPAPVTDQERADGRSVVEKIHSVIITIFKMRRPDRGESERLNQVLGHYFRYERRRKGFTSFLHSAVERFLITTNDDELIIAVEVIQLFVDNGVDPRICDYNGKTALHLLAESCSPNCKESYFAAFVAVLEGGGHLDQMSADGVTVLQILQQKKKQLKNGEKLDPRIDDWINAVLMLQCYSAQKVPEESTTDSNTIIPLDFKEFVAQHQTPKDRQPTPTSPTSGPRSPSGYRTLGIPF